ncbi:helix-turn-helix domain-containing protein [Sphingomonas nostoxanthinifaciens]|uniref:helix-turn-helix domain-containing protein n=1 Tax=Sphingomonas nostoxanthinifaciens TaxID=2872652 RepID=UPI001CC20D11|nr:helix-turn-helix domain-containing protein [Sphingomonas nostoxanthinifaciens]UAK23633.1 helix-turn-helix domain-containing protein [Sphingomonas nostoxanthinifaciens]
MGALAKLDHSPRVRWGRLLSADDAAEYLGISRTTLATLTIPSKGIGRRVLYDIRDLDRFVDRMGEQAEAAVPAEPTDAAAIAAEEQAFFERRKKRSGRN